MARVLIVGCGCRGRALAGALAADGHAVRGTTRSEDGIEAIEAAGAEGVVADPDRLGTLLPHIQGVTVLCWLMGSVDAHSLHGDRLAAIAEKLVDTHVRGMVYEAAGTAPEALLSRGAAIVRRAAETWLMPVEVVEADPAGHDAWLADAGAAVNRVLAA